MENKERRVQRSTTLTHKLTDDNFNMYNTDNGSEKV